MNTTELASIETQINSTRRLLKLAKDQRSCMTLDSTASALLTVSERLLELVEQQQQQIDDLEALIRQVEIERPIAAAVADGAVYKNWNV